MGDKINVCHTERKTKEGVIISISLKITKLVDDFRKINCIATTERELSEMKMLYSD